MTVVSGIHCDLTPPPEWQSTCDERGDLFHSPAWQSVLCRGFRCVSLYLWDAQARAGCALPVFPLGPFRMGYLGFPAGGGIGTLSAPASIAENLDCLSYGRRIDAIRVPISGFSRPLLSTQRSVSAPETAIVDLAGWSADRLPPPLRRNLRKFQRSDLELRPCVDARGDAERCYRLYRGTIDRHRGRRRYSRAYFRALLELSLSSDRLRCTGAYAGGELAGFLVAACSGATAFYLHGASDPRFQMARPSDALFENAILWAKGVGADLFDMMSSPPSQEGLVRFKEKWGGTTRQHRTCTVAVSRIGGLAVGLLRLGGGKKEPSVLRRG
ncbi:MAG TPA: GNAT family N-acetyltransferase [Gammaproteobacteria bacterium]|nr:GNAT family N-acetyltransferase [Gammaproteobacteria bacterium]